MPTTPRGIIYPNAAGHTRLWDHLQQLASSTDTAIENTLPADTGWLPITFAATWSGTAVARRIGNQVHLGGTAVRSSGTATIIGNMPAGMAPPSSLNVIVRGAISFLTFALPSSGGVVVGSAYTNGTTLFLESVPPFLLD